MTVKTNRVEVGGSANKTVAHFMMMIVTQLFIRGSLMTLADPKFIASFFTSAITWRFMHTIMRSRCTLKLYDVAMLVRLGIHLYLDLVLILVSEVVW